MPLFVKTTGQDHGERTVSFIKDIQLMMYGLGDSPLPLVETAELIEEIVLRQMVCVLNKASIVTNMRGEETIAPEDILFLMRNNLEGLKRLIEYLGVKDEMLNKTVTAAQDDVETHYQIQENLPITWQTSRKLYCFEFLKSIGIDEIDVESTQDNVKRERLIRANQMALHLSKSDYSSYQAARQASFGATQMTPLNFIKWLKQKGRVHCELKPPVVELLVYLAKETIARIIDKVILLREESSKDWMIHPPPISIHEVREVIRLYYQLQSVPMSLFSRDILNYVESRLIAI